MVGPSYPPLHFNLKNFETSSIDLLPMHFFSFWRKPRSIICTRNAV